MVSITWATDEVISFRTEEIFEIEQATSLYFSDLLADKSHSAFQDNSQVIDTIVSVRKQKVGRESVILESTVEVMNIGEEGILDVAALLMFLTNKNTTSSSFEHLDSMMSIDYSIDMISFTNQDAASTLVVSIDQAEASAMTNGRYTAKEKTLITVTSILAFALFAISFILIWVAGGWLALRKQVQVLLYREEVRTREIKQNPTQDTDEEAISPSGSQGKETQFTNPSGILGVHPYYGKSGRALDGFGIQIADDKTGDVFTPMSEAYSDTGRAPIGITSMRKLIPGRGESTPTGAQRNSLEAFGMKKLEYTTSGGEK
jgi:hypothetical protein